MERVWGGVPKGLRLMAAGAFSFSIMLALLKAAGTSLPLFEIVAGRSLVVALLAGLGVWRQGHSFVPTEWRLGGWIGVTVVDVLLLIGIGVATHVGQVCITWAFRMERAGAVSAVGYLQIVFAAAWGWLLFGEVPDGWTWVGAGVIVVATFGITRLHPPPEPAAIVRTR